MRLNLATAVSERRVESTPHARRLTRTFGLGSAGRGDYGMGAG
jgi:hypothetical protein